MDCIKTLQKDSVFGVDYAITDMEEATSYLIDSLKTLSGKYICFSNVHTLVTAIEDEKYLRALNGSAVTFPDGAPVASALRRKGNARARRVAGPDFMERILQKTAGGPTRHFFYGSTQHTLGELVRAVRAKYPGIDIAGSFSPTFEDLSEAEENEITDIINKDRPDIIWVGLGAPKQEIFMASHEDRFDGVMIGVGAAFDFIAGTKKRAPVFMQRMHLEWLYRLLSEPVRLGRRYLVTNTKYLWYRLTKKE